jgi:dihydrofolate synthase/folylpolyglutamate synthase
LSDVPSDAAVAYERAREWLYGLSRGGVKLGLDRMRAILASVGRPDRRLRFVHVAGTNGKGSVSAIVHRALVLEGHRAGLYTSPHLHTVRERVVIDDEMVSEEVFAAEVSRLRALVEEGTCPVPTFFEAITAIALMCFAGRVDLVVLEVGLGGRLDATNAVDSVLVSVITSIGLDHESWLGSTVERIASEKAGILRKDVPVVVNVTDPRALRVIRNVAKRGAPLVEAGLDAEARAVIAGVTPSLAGAHQRENAMTAASTLLVVRRAGVAVSDDSIRRAVATVAWPGRLERIEGEPDVLFDAAHNPDGVEALAGHLSTLPREGRRVMLFGVMGDKDWPSMLRTLAAHIDERVYAAPALGRAERLENLDAFAPGHMAASVRDGLALAQQRAGKKGLVIVAGSIFLLAEARAALLGIAQEPPIAM